MIESKQLIKWLATLPEESFVEVDAGGLTLRATNAGVYLDAYLEIGGACEDDETHTPKFELHVGNIGRCVASEDKLEAEAAFYEYAMLSERGIGRAAGESVTLFCDGEPILDHAGDKYLK
jgi:hypothetical protein